MIKKKNTIYEHVPYIFPENSIQYDSYGEIAFFVIKKRYVERSVRSPNTVSRENGRASTTYKTRTLPTTVGEVKTDTLNRQAYNPRVSSAVICVFIRLRENKKLRSRNAFINFHTSTDRLSDNNGRGTTYPRALGVWGLG